MIQEDFLAKVRKTESCWLWTGSTAGRGYGQVGRRNTPEKYAHRLSWHLFNGPILDGQHVLHKCDVPLCVNPAHLFLGTPFDNVHDCISKKRFVYRPRQEKCQRGHLMIPGNLHFGARGNRHCKTCTNARTLANYYRRKAAPGMPS